MTSSSTEEPPLPADPPGEGEAAEQEGSERRTSPRKLVHWRIKLMHESGSGQVMTHGKAVDASMTGISLLCDQNMAKSTRLILAIALPVARRPNSFEEVHVSATVVNSIYAQGDFRLGLQFTKFHGRAKEALTAILA